LGDYFTNSSCHTEAMTRLKWDLCLQMASGYTPDLYHERSLQTVLYVNVMDLSPQLSDMLYLPKYIHTYIHTYIPGANPTTFEFTVTTTPALL
jgi:hypothetical protein